MRNIGVVSRRWLTEIEIFSLEDLQQVGAVSAWQHIKLNHPKQANRNLLWALIGAERDLDWREIPNKLKQNALVEAGLMTD